MPLNNSQKLEYIASNEDLMDLPFVGNSVKLLDKLLNTIQLARKDDYTYNIFKYRPSNNRDPLPAKIIIASLYLRPNYQLFNQQ